MIHTCIPRGRAGLGLVLCLLFLGACKTDKTGQETTEVVQIDDSAAKNPWTQLDWNNEPDNFQFVVVTDRTGGMRPGVFEQGVDKVNLLQPEFVMSVGDLIQGYTEDLDELNRQWDEFDGFVEQLNMPFFYVVGNHDVTNKVMEGLWKERLGALYYHFVYRDVLFLCLNSEEGLDAHRSSFFSEEQRAYVKKTLEENPDVRWTMVFMHKPVWLAEENEQMTEGEPEYERSGWKEIEGLLQDRKHTVFAGHIHRYTHRERNQNNQYISLATTGGGSSLRGPIFGQFDHVMWITMTDEGPLMANVMLEGIFDEDFSQEDIQKYLEMNLARQAVKIESDFDMEKPPVDSEFTIRVNNSEEVPMLFTMDLESMVNFDFTPAQINKTLEPNSVEFIKVKMKVSDIPTEGTIEVNGKEEPAWYPMWSQMYNYRPDWKITYEIERYGEIEVKGTKRLF